MFEATLCFLLDGEQVLLIEKKRGAGAGLYNAPGGKLEAGETPRESATREVREEIHVAVHSLDKTAELRFILGEDPFSKVHVFRTTEFEGSPQPTDEATPVWFHRTDLPFDDMWAGDQYWIPRILAGESIKGTVWFDATGDSVIDYRFEAASFP